ncbi:fumarylacetoacetate hydrolase family protein [Vaginella massiliensis]|uniref:fumarylacetoacetate hydrolase family protein n=1 Tax=Vaginella massiliensis TaxID=1816680 RepID=UPI0008386E6C|nr:fumarylacetoacetate hydrolase family protein [Vaginella massiliensis]
MKIFCIGRNYAEHAKELNNDIPSEPMFFLKPDTALMRNDLFVIPPFSNEIHFEVEVVIKISKVGKMIQPQFAHRYYEEVGLGIDFTARDVQTELKAQRFPWEKAKAFDNSAYVSKFFPKESLPIDNLSFGLKKNDEWMQQGNTQDMLFTYDVLIAEISKYMTLKTGDMIFTGTPKGVGSLASKDIIKGYLNDTQVFELKVL